jgi:integrase
MCGLFLAGLRRSEVSALKPDDLDWITPKIAVRRSWQMFNSKNRVMGAAEGKEGPGRAL